MKNKSVLILLSFAFGILFWLGMSTSILAYCECTSGGDYYCFSCVRTGCSMSDLADCAQVYRGPDNSCDCCNYTVWENDSPKCCTGCGCTPTCGGSYPLGSCSGPGCSSGQRCCTNVDSCGDACGGQTCKTCYVCNPPAAPATPTTVSLRVNTTDYNLSTNLSSPTIIDYRNGGTIKVFSNPVSNPTTDYYKYNVYNAYTGGTPLLDYAGTTQIQPASGSLAYSHIGRFEAMHYNLKCPDNSANYSSTLTGYYCMERNVKPPTKPTGINLIIDGQTYVLSTSAVEPRVVKYPTTDATKTNTKLHVLPVRSTPTTASASGYRVEANNYGLGKWMDFSCTRGEDFCNEGASNEFNFDPNTEPLLEVLKQGAEGKIDGKYYDVNECDPTKVYSDPEDFYYRVNHNPNLDPENPLGPENPLDPEDPLDPENPDSRYNCPSITNNSDDRTSTRDCVSTTYTGIEVNNPLKLELVGTDLDGVEEIKGAIVWLSKNGTLNQIPDFPTISGTYTRSDPNHIAVMIVQRDGSWENTPLLYAPDVTNGYNWGNITSHREIRTTEGVMASVGNVNVNVEGEIVRFKIELVFNEVTPDQSVYPEGNYDISGLVFDEYMLLAGGTVVDQFYMSRDCRAEGWNIDLRRPTFESGFPDSDTIFSRLLGLSWKFNGTGSYATDAVINAYSYTETEDVILESPSGYSNITLSPPPSEEEIGVVSDSNAWDLVNPVDSEIYDSNARINIGTNDDGTIIFYVTGLDQACNYVVSDGAKTTINLNPWITSKGGFMYSGGDTGAHAKDYTAYSTFINSILRRVTAEELDIATEVVTSRSDTINDFVHPELAAVRASRIPNSSGERKNWYEYFSKRLNEQIVELGQDYFEPFSFPAGKLTNPGISNYCVDGEYCYMNVQGDLYIVPSSQLTCDKKTLIMASGNIYIEPDIINGGDDNINGCLFIAGGSIYVGAGRWKTGNATGIEETKYDYLDAYLVANDIIDLQLVDIEDSLGSVIYTRDGLEIYGGLVAFGENIPTGASAVQANRSFGLWNAYIPTTAITWDPRYAKLAEAFFGPTAGMYKREVGFKPY